MRVSAVLAVVALVLCGCSDDDTGSDGTGSPGTGSPGTGTGDGTSSDDDAGSSDLPGGVSGTDVLEEGNWLDDEGRVAGGPSTSSDDKEERAAICAYMFGEPDEVADTARLDGEVTLDDENSGYTTLGSNGTGFSCLYNVSGEPRLQLRIWSQPADTDDTDDTDDADEPEHVVEVPVSGDQYGWSGYAPGYDGDAMSEATAREWLTAAGSRVAGGSV